MARNRRNKNQQPESMDMDDVAEKVALGATGLALAAGAVAAGAVMASRGARRNLQKRATNTMKGLGDVLQSGAERYQAVQHRISGLGKGRSTGRKGRSKSRYGRNQEMM